MWKNITPDTLKNEITQTFADLETKLASIQTTLPENPLLFYHELIVQAPKLVTIAGHLNSLRGDLGFSDIEVYSET